MLRYQDPRNSLNLQVLNLVTFRTVNLKGDEQEKLIFGSWSPGVLATVMLPDNRVSNTTHNLLGEPRDLGSQCNFLAIIFLSFA